MAFYFRSCLSYVKKHDSGYPFPLLDPYLFPIRMGDHSVGVVPANAQKVLPHLQALLPFFILTCPK